MSYLKQVKFSSNFLEITHKILLQNILILCWLIIRLIYSRFHEKYKSRLRQKAQVANEILISAKALTNKDYLQSVSNDIRT